MAKTAHSRFAALATIIISWVACIGFYVLITVNLTMKNITNDLEETGTILNRLISQRLAQHDAHLTTLSSLIVADEKQQLGLLDSVSYNIMRFYPSIVAIQEVDLSLDTIGMGSKTSVTFSAPKDARFLELGSSAVSILALKIGEAKSYVSSSFGSIYLLAKKVTESNPATILLMQIDPSKLINIEDVPSNISIKLMLDNAVIMESFAHQDGTPWISAPHYERIIDSQSQPLTMTIERPVVFAELINGIGLLLFALTSLGLIFLVGFSYRHRQQFKYLQHIAQKAEQRTALFARETRLAHASRVNSLGELASGITHELAQPLTAIMSQSRAAERLFEQSGVDNQLIKDTMAANVREARRAGDILKRMRDYISNRSPEVVEVAINKVVQDSVELLRSDLESRHILLDIKLGQNIPILMADPVELEQVFNNLIRNAADSLDETHIVNARITIITSFNDSHINVDISDNGVGLNNDVLPRLFEPFFTTKNEGMGLGLALCSTLLERINGRLEVKNNETDGACFTVHIPVRRSNP